jgi:hypothetical protein
MADYAKRASWLRRVACHIEDDTVFCILNECAAKISAKTNSDHFFSQDRGSTNPRKLIDLCA